MRRTLVAALLVLAVAIAAARVARPRPTPAAPPRAPERGDAFDALGGSRGSTPWGGVRPMLALDLLIGRRFGGAGAGTGVGVRRISRDTTTAFDAEHETQVEPSSLAVGSTIVAAFQNGRYDAGGAAAIGWATTLDGGTRWRTGTLAQTRYAVVSDPVVAYDALHASWLIGALGRGDAGDVELWVSRSHDGLTWSRPVVAAADPGENYDKEWVTCDNGAASPYRGRCYLVYVEFDAQQLGVRRSLDGGRTWSAAVTVAPGSGRLVFTGPFPVVRPDGTLVIPFSLFPQDGPERVAVTVSRDGGSSFGVPSTVAIVDFADDADFRAEVMPSAAVDAAGRIYAVWSDSALREDGDANDVLLATSADGVTWSAPARVPLRRTASGVDVSYFLPAIAVAPGSSGRTAKLAVAVYSLRLRNGCATFLPGCTKQVEAWLVRSDDGGRTWQPAKALATAPMMLGWLATSGRGAMVGDYVSVSWSGGRPWAVLPLATRAPLGLSEAIFAATAS